MRIGLVLSSTPPYSETFFRNKIAILTKHGYDVILFADHQKDEFEGCEVRGGISGKNPFYKRLKAVFRLVVNLKQSIRLFRANSNDGFTLKNNILSLLTSAHMLGYKLDWLHFGFATIAINRENTAASIGAKMAISVRGSDMHVYPLFHPGCYNLVWKRIDKLHYISNYLFKLSIQNGFSSRQASSMLITPAIDINQFQAPETRTQRSKLVLCTVARLHWIKGIEYILEALRIIKNKGIDFEYHLIGDGDEYRRLFFAAHQLGIKDHVIFHGKLSHPEINNVLASSELFIMYSLDEGFCNSVLEAQSMGCLALVSDNEALMENVIDGVTGWVVKGRHPELLANKIIGVFNMSDVEKNNIRLSAVNRVKETFGLKHQLEKFVQFYQ